MDMDKVWRMIMTLVLAVALWHVATDVFADKGTGGEEPVHHVAGDVSASHFHAGQKDASFSLPLAPSLPEAELNGATVQCHLLLSMREKRFAESSFSLKEGIDLLSRRNEILSLHRSRLYPTTTSYCCCPACGYYIFTLRRILI